MTETMTQDIPRVEWPTQLQELSSRYQGWRTSIRVMGGEIGDQRVAADLPLQGFSVETQGSEAGKILIELGDSPNNFMIHHVDYPLRVQVAEMQPGSAADVEIESEDGTVTLVGLRAPTALPSRRQVAPGERGFRRRGMEVLREKAHRLGRPSKREPNVGNVERFASVAAGSLLAALGLSRRSVSGVLTAGVGAALIYRGVTGYCHAYGAMDVDTAHRKGERAARSPEEITRQGIHVEQSCLINKSPEELYEFWRHFENLPRIMNHLHSVRVLDDRRSHWVAKAPRIAGGEVEWDAEITRDEPGSVIAWRSLPGGQIDSVGEIRFRQAMGDRGTEVHVSMDYIPPAGQLGHWMATLFGEAPQRQMREDLRNFKRIMEVGEILTIEGQPRGTCTGMGRERRSTETE